MCWSTLGRHQKTANITIVPRRKCSPFLAQGSPSTTRRSTQVWPPLTTSFPKWLPELRGSLLVGQSPMALAQVRLFEADLASQKSRTAASAQLFKQIFYLHPFILPKHVGQIRSEAKKKFEGKWRRKIERCRVARRSSCPLRRHGFRGQQGRRGTSTSQANRTEQPQSPDRTA